MLVLLVVLLPELVVFVGVTVPCALLLVFVLVALVGVAGGFVIYGEVKIAPFTPVVIGVVFGPVAVGIGYPGTADGYPYPYGLE